VFARNELKSSVNMIFLLPFSGQCMQLTKVSPQLINPGPMSSHCKKEEQSWILYDVANSAFVLVVVTAILPIFFKDYIAQQLSQATSTALWGYMNSAASMTVALISPFAGRLADRYHSKKLFFAVFLILGLLATTSLSIIEQGQIIFCVFAFLLARIGWSGANLFYDAFLCDVTSKDRMDRVSSFGYGFGYIGSIVPFLVIIWLILSAGMANGLPVTATRTGFLIVALWWFIFSLPMLKNVRQKKIAAQQVSTTGTNLLQTLKDISRDRHLLLFLLAYFFYIDGVGTVISMSTAYGRDLGFGVTLLIIVLLFIQVVAFPFALLYGKLAKRFSTLNMLLAGIGIYILITLLAFLLPWITSQQIKTVLFWVIAFLVASSMGGIQALSRSYFARIIPIEKSGEYFGFFNIFGKFAAIAGPLLMAIVTSISGDSRWGILSMLILFTAGGFFLNKIRTMK